MDDRKDAAPQGSGSSANAMPAGATSERPATEQRADRVPTPAVAAPQGTTPMHGEAQGVTLPTCDWCEVVFKPKRAWARFCGPGCRNTFHQATEPKKVREARELVRLVLAGEADPANWNPRARKLLGIK